MRMSFVDEMQRNSTRNLNRIMRRGLALLDPNLSEAQVQRRLKASEKRAARDRALWEEMKK
jgi:hypothetical protein